MVIFAPVFPMRSKTKARPKKRPLLKFWRCLRKRGSRRRIMNHELRIKKILIALSLLIPTVLLVFNPTKILADGEEVKRGEEIWQKLSTSQLKCENLSDGEFKNLGEFFMERMTGSVANH